MKQLFAFLCALTGLAGSAATAQSAHICDDWQSQAWNLAEPWEDNSRTFSNGAVRVALIDTVEPALGAYYLLTLHPLPDDPLGSRVCHIVGETPFFGFPGMDFSGLSASYDPAVGLTFTVPVTRATEDGSFFSDSLQVIINQKFSDVRVSFE